MNWITLKGEEEHLRMIPGFLPEHLIGDGTIY